MVEYHAAYYQGEEGWLVAQVLDFPGAASQGRTLRSARKMIRDALREMAQALIEDGQSLPAPNPKARDHKALFQEKLALTIRVQGNQKNETAKALATPAKVRLQRL